MLNYIKKLLIGISTLGFLLIIWIGIGIIDRDSIDDRGLLEKPAKLPDEKNALSELEKLDLIFTKDDFSYDRSDDLVVEALSYNKPIK